MRQSERTRTLLIKHYQTYPKLKIQDVFKFLYHSAFGCDHLVSSLETAIEYIAKEYDTIRQEGEPVIEALDGAYSRVPLSYLNRGLCVDTFGRLFASSAKAEKDGLSDLIQKLEVAKELVKEGLLPFCQDEFENAVAEWETKGYPAIHHSEVFRDVYRPSYRVIANEYIPFLDFFTEVDKRLVNGSVIVAIEGGSASGKTTLGSTLSNIYDCTLFHMDDFFLQPGQRTPERYAQIGGNVDWERFLTEVLEPLSKGEAVNYRKFDCSTMSVEDAIQVIPKKLTIIEGAYSLHPELEKYYDFSVFLDVSAQLQKERIQKRNSPQLAKRFFEEWIPLENVYFSKTKVKERCDLTIPIF